MRNYRIWFGILLFLTLYFFCVIFHSMYEIRCKSEITKINQSNEMVPLVLFYTPLVNIELPLKEAESIFQNCEHRCTVSNDPKLYPLSDVAIFHSRQMYMNEFLQKYRNPNRLNVFYTLEAFPHERIRKKHFPKDFFNVTTTFRFDSTIAKPYDKFEKILSHERHDSTKVWSNIQIKRILSKKTQLAVQFVSHCVTHSLREKITEDMKKYANISTYGSCYGITNKDENEELEKHFFYLAFENSVCKDYVTEKFWRIKDLIVPVVMKRSILKGIVEDEYFIAADDFNSSQALVDRLIYLSKNITEYKKYFTWTKKYKKTKTKTFGDNSFCEICEMAVKKERHIIPDIYQWWENESQCQFNYLNYTLQR